MNTRATIAPFGSRAIVGLGAAMLVAAAVVSGCAGSTDSPATTEEPSTPWWSLRRPPPARVDQLDPDRYDRRRAGEAGPGEVRDEATGEDAADDRAEPEPRTAASWRPTWWHDAAQREGGRVFVCAFADGLDLVGARARALDLARATLARELGAGDPAGGEAGASGRAGDTTLADSLRLPDGRYRAFVRISRATK